jgi:hypothetical protein
VTLRIRPDDILLVAEVADTGTVLDLPCGCRYRYRRLVPERGCVEAVGVRKSLHVIAVDASDGLLVERTANRGQMFLHDREKIPYAQCIKAKVTHG